MNASEEQRAIESEVEALVAAKHRMRELESMLARMLPLVMTSAIYREAKELLERTNRG